VQLTYADGTTKVVALNDVGDSYGSVVCPFPPCSAVSVEIGKDGFGGIYTPSQLVDNQVQQQTKKQKRLLIS
jgi:hypothetical protein